jgi:hypothetical protein
MRRRRGSKDARIRSIHRHVNVQSRHEGNGYFLIQAERTRTSRSANCFSKSPKSSWTTFFLGRVGHGWSVRTCVLAHGGMRDMDDIRTSGVKAIVGQSPLYPVHCRYIASHVDYVPSFKRNTSLPQRQRRAGVHNQRISVDDYNLNRHLLRRQLATHQRLAHGCDRHTMKVPILLKPRTRRGLRKSRWLPCRRSSFRY